MCSFRFILITFSFIITIIIIFFKLKINNRTNQHYMLSSPQQKRMKCRNIVTYMCLKSNKIQKIKLISHMLMYARDKRNINNECNKTFESFAVQYTLIIHTNTLYIFKLILLVSFFICIHVTFTRY